MGTASVVSFALAGIEAVPIHVEAHVRPGLPGVTIVGLPDAAVREARERVRSAAALSGFPVPTQRITVGLSPADVRKEGPAFDLPVALAVLAAAGYLAPKVLRGVTAVGELGLEGDIRGVRGVLAMAEAAAQAGAQALLVPVESLAEAAAVAPSLAVGVRHLAEAMAACQSREALERLRERGMRWVRRYRQRPPSPAQRPPDFADVAGHRAAKRALEIGAAGRHHLLMIGPPGVGKTMLARRIPGILPSMTGEEAREVTRIWSAAGLLRASGGLVTERPFRSPHHTASTAALIGGGSPPHPGEVTLAHQGVLFLDEFPEFDRDALEAMREPLEDGRILVSRRTGAVLFPASFTLVAAMNPCPCGYLGHPTVACTCSPGRAEHYRRQISGPLLDRLDMLLEVPPLTIETLAGESGREEEASEKIQERVTAARCFRTERETCRAATQEPTAGVSAPRRLEREAQLFPGAAKLLRRYLARECAGGRSHARLVALSRTIADLDQSLWVTEDHVAEAAGLHLRDRATWKG